MYFLQLQGPRVNEAKTSNKQAVSKFLHVDCEGRTDKFIRNGGGLLPNYMALQARIS
jgi:hypothetical protein